MKPFSKHALRDFLARFDYEPPLVISLAVLSTKGLGFYPREPQGMNDYFHFLRPIEESVLVAPDTVIHDGDCDIAERLRPAFDALWQASGWPGSPGYDDDGKRVGMNRWLPGA